MAQAAHDLTRQDLAAMFKIYVGCDKDHTLKADQVARFEALRERSRETA